MRGASEAGRSIDYLMRIIGNLEFHPYLLLNVVGP